MRTWQSLVVAGILIVLDSHGSTAQNLTECQSVSGAFHQLARNVISRHENGGNWSYSAACIRIESVDVLGEIQTKLNLRIKPAAEFRPIQNIAHLLPELFWGGLKNASPDSVEALVRAVNSFTPQESATVSVGPWYVGGGSGSMIVVFLPKARIALVMRTGHSS